MQPRSEIEAINDQIVFEFLEDTTHGKFNEKTAGGLLIVEKADKQVHHCRWGRVLEKGPLVSDAIKLDDIILIEHLCWTNKFRLTETDYWITNEESIVAMWDYKDNLPKEVA